MQRLLAQVNKRYRTLQCAPTSIYHKLIVIHQKGPPLQILSSLRGSTPLNTRQRLASSWSAPSRLSWSRTLCLQMSWTTPQSAPPRTAPVSPPQVFWSSQHLGLALAIFKIPPKTLETTKKLAKENMMHFNTKFTNLKCFFSFFSFLISGLDSMLEP